MKCMIILACALIAGCTLFGGGTKPAEIKKACKESISESLNETKIVADITLYMDNNPVTGTLTGGLSNSYNPPSTVGVPTDGGSMILKLLNITWIFLLIQVFVTWGVTILLKLKGIKIKLLSVSVLVNLLVILVSMLLVLWLGIIKIHWIDIIGTQIAGWGIQALLYDSLIKKLISKKE